MNELILDIFFFFIKKVFQVQATDLIHFEIFYRRQKTKHIIFFMCCEGYSRDETSLWKWECQASILVWRMEKYN